MTAGNLHVEVLGSVGPVTVFCHGLAGGADDCRPWAAAAPGRAALMELSGHGRSRPVPDNGWSYDTFAADIDEVCRAQEARSIVAVSVAAGAVLHLLAADPSRFDRVVLVLPAALDTERDDVSTRRLHDLADLAGTGQTQEIVLRLLAELPADVADTRLARVWATRRARRLVEAPPPLPCSPLLPPVADISALAAVTAPVLVLAEKGDALHPLQVAESVARAVPGARLQVRPHGALHWTDREGTAAEIGAHLTGDAAQG